MMLPWEKRLSMTVGTFVEASTVPSVRSAGPTLWQEGVGEVSQKEGRKETDPRIPSIPLLNPFEVLATPIL